MPDLDLTHLVLQRFDVIDAKIDAVKAQGEASAKAESERIAGLSERLHGAINTTQNLVTSLQQTVEENTRETVKIKNALFGDGTEFSGVIEKTRELWRAFTEAKENRKEWQQAKFRLWMGIITVGLATFFKDWISHIAHVIQGGPPR